MARKSVFEEDTGEDFEDVEEELDDGVSPARRPKQWIDEPYDIDLVTEVLSRNKGIDLCVVDISSKVDWIKYMVFVTGELEITLLT